MIIDSSVLVAMIEAEPEGPGYLTAISEATIRRLSVANWLETCLVLDNRSPSHARKFDELITSMQVEVVPVTLDQARVARAAHRRFGRGSGSKARLNYGDCFAYALAITTGEPLLFKGEDFAHTDISPAV